MYTGSAGSQDLPRTETLLAGSTYLPRVQEVSLTRYQHAVVVHGQVFYPGL